MLPADTALSSAVFATLQDTFPRYFGLPVPPSLNLKDPEGKVLLGIQHRKETKDYTVAEAWISGKLPGLHEYKLTLTFYDENHRLLGTSHVRQKLLGPKEEAGPDGGGPNKLIDIVGRGSWSNYKEVTVQVDQVTGIKAQ
ncbi:hypothetical protein LJK88_45995 [Paenibacillus sp. P26]|nr:hypothetical protein LJK88_45995 [Paenibacillus sp. P26]UUZ92032.1 hypothetical protein LJK87_42360 [Paenibacillus sp. P25]